jgi:hypothetical protein
MAKQPKETEQPDRAELLAQFLTICTVLKMAVDEGAISALTDEELKAKIDLYTPAADRITEAEAERQKLADQLEEEKAKVASGKSPTDGIVPVKKLIVRRPHQGSGRLTIRCGTEDKMGNRTPGFDIGFPDDLKLVFHSDYQTLPPNVLDFYGGKENVLGMIKAKIDAENEKSPNSFVYLTDEKFQALLAQASILDAARQVVDLAVANPEDPQYKEFFDMVNKLSTAKRTTLVTQGPVGAGPMSK